MKEFLIEILNNQFVMQIIFTTTLSFVVYMIYFIADNGGLWRNTELIPPEHIIFFECDPLLRIIVIPALLSWLIYDKPFIKLWFLWTIDHSLVIWIIAVLFVLMVGLWILQIAMWVCCLVRGNINRIIRWKNNKRKQRIAFTTQEEEVFDFCVYKFPNYTEKYLVNELTRFVEAKEIIYKSLLCLHILNPKGVGDYYGLRDFEYDIEYYPEKHPVKQYYAKFEKYPLFIQERIENDSKMFETMNLFIKSMIREYKSCNNKGKK
ncbi:hypothetical protein [Bacillus thuringiensis]|uniref:hypothetical protein n=1 Tax=Bacillus thuringiensis TaxID=1428 RepID=UPI0026E42024|nr:hypothetical protein [Bacillus thuringiensis]MDO6631853.1 hypothetical protein [Bacillus thuringiensis]MDO6661540.1 hypothetical protein [Bacillus thuringiensis]MDO6701993.1 hypothetical protein [Bacillus thuringiensis]